MLKIKIDEDKLKSTTDEYFNTFYINLVFSNIDSMNIEFSSSKLYKDKILLVTEVEKTTTPTDNFSNNRLRSRKGKLNGKKVTETVYLDYDYLMELVNSNGLELKYLDSNMDGTNIKYKLSFSTKEENLQKIKK